MNSETVLWFALAADSISLISFAFIVSEPAPLDTLTMRAPGASPRSGTIAW